MGVRTNPQEGLAVYRQDGIEIAAISNGVLARLFKFVKPYDQRLVLVLPLQTLVTGRKSGRRRSGCRSQGDLAGAGVSKSRLSPAACW